MPNIPNVPTPADPSGIIAAFNALVASIKAGISGVLVALGSPTVFAATTAQTIMAYTLSPSQLPVGGYLRIRLWGVNGGSVSTNTLTCNFGALALSVAVTGTSAAWYAEFNINNYGAATQQGEAHAVQGTTPVALANTAGTVNTAAAVAITVTSTNSVASQLTVNGGTMEIVQ